MMATTLIIIMALGLLSFAWAQDTTTTGRWTMTTVAGNGNSMNAWNSPDKPVPGEDPVGKSLYFSWGYGGVKYSMSQAHFFLSDNADIKRIWRFKSTDTTDSEVIVGPDYDVFAEDDTVDTFDESDGRSIRLDKEVTNLATGIDVTTNRDILYFSQGLEKGGNTYPTDGWIRKAKENVDGGWSVSDYVGVHFDGGAPSAQPTQAPTTGILPTSDPYCQYLREAKTLVSKSSDSDAEIYGTNVFNDMAVNPVDNMLYLAAGLWETSSSNARFNYNEYNFRINRIRKVQGIDYIEYWAGKNNENHNCAVANVGPQGVTGFPGTHCDSGTYVPSSDYADGLHMHNTTMRPMVITFDNDGNLYYYCGVAYMVRKIQASDNKVYSLFGHGYSGNRDSNGNYFYRGIYPDTSTADTGDFFFSSNRYDNDRWYDEGNEPVNSNYPLYEMTGIDVDDYENIYILRHYMLMVYMKEGNDADKLKWLVNMKLSDDIAQSRAQEVYPAGSYENGINDVRDPLAYRSLSGGGQGYIQAFSVKKSFLTNSTNSSDSNVTGPIGDVLFVDSNDFTLSKSQFRCPAGSMIIHLYIYTFDFQNKYSQ